MKKILLVLALIASFSAYSQFDEVEISVSGTKSNFLFNFDGNVQAKKSADITWDIVSGKRIIFYEKGKVIGQRVGFLLENVKLSPNDINYALYGLGTPEFATLNEFKTWAVNSVGFKTPSGSSGGASSFSELTGTILNGQLTEEGIRQFETTFQISASQIPDLPAGGSADGVVTGVTLSGSLLQFTGSNGGYDGDIDLSGLGGGGVTVVSTVAEMTTNSSFYELTQTDGEVPVGLYYKNSLGELIEK